MIYCIEDDDGIRELIIYTLNKSGYEAKGFPNSVDFWPALESELPELILLDIMLPIEDGLTILKTLRSGNLTASIPVIMTTAKGTEYDKVTGLDLGADDYLCKPFGMMEMVSRVNAVLRRCSSPAVTTLSIGNLTMDTARHLVMSCNERVQLTLKEFELLKLFMENVGLVFTRDQLLQNIWGNDFIGESRTIDVHIGTLRTKLGECGCYIETVRGVGYKMEVPHD